MFPPVQTKVVQWASDFVSKQLNTEVSIDHIAFKPFQTLNIQKFLVRDEQRDTLLFVSDLSLGISSLDIKRNAYHASSLRLDSGYFNLYRIEESEAMNLDFITQLFSSSDTSSQAVNFKVYADLVEINHLRFRYEDYKVDLQAQNQIDFSHLYVSDLTGVVEDVFLDGPNIKASVLHLAIREKSGFELSHLSGETYVSDTAIICSNISLDAGKTHLKGFYSMHSESWKSYANFLDEVVMDASLDTSVVDFHDVAFFSKNIDDMLTPLKFVGTAKGTVSNLKANIDYLTFGNSGSLVGDVKIKGLPDIGSTFFDADFKQLYASISDIDLLKIPNGTSVEPLVLPEQVRTLGFVRFKGNFVGFLSDFVAYGSAETALGVLKADINLKTPNDTLKYSGSLASKGFQLGKLLGAEPTVKKTAFDLEIDGKGSDVESMWLDAKGQVTSIDVLGYKYKNVRVDGLLHRQVFEGNVLINDTNVKLDFNGLVNFKSDVPQIKCVSKVSGLHLDKINLVPSDTNGELSANFTLDMSGKTMSELHGNLFVTDLYYANPKRRISIDTISLADKLIPGGHDIHIKSTIGNIDIVGSTNLFDLPYAFVKVSQPYAPRWFDQKILKGKDTTQIFDYSLKLRYDPKIVGLFSDELSWTDTLQISGRVDAANADFELDMAPLTWSYKEYVFDSNRIEVKPSKDSLMISFNARKCATNQAIFLENFNVESILTNDSLNAQVSWFNETNQADSGFIDIWLYRSDKYLLNAYLNKLDVRVAGVQWRSKQKAQLHADTNYVEVEHLNLRSNSGYVTCNGSWSGLTNEHLVFDVSNFDLGYISNFGISKNQFEGMFNGQIDMYQRQTSFVADADITIDSLIVDGFEIGTLQGSSEYNIAEKALILNLDLSYKGDRNVQITGDYRPFTDEDQLFLNARFKSFRASVLEPFINDFTSELDGTIDGNVTITGIATNPELNGKLNLKDFQLKINYLNTKYQIANGDINIKPDFIGMDVVPISDGRKTNTTLTAGVFHENFSDFNYDIFIDADNFLCLNTTEVDNEDYYGTARITGHVNIGGYLGQTTIDAEVATEKGTVLNIPLSDQTSVGQADYIRFVEPPSKKKTQQEQRVEEAFNGLALNFQLEVDNDAQIQIIFDEQVGDIIKVVGNGDILMNIDNRGTFNMYGDYVITSGDYLFTLQSLINKRFSVQPGSRLTWSGSPYDASIDLAAIYKLRASPYPLVAGIDDSPVYEQRMPVDVYLNMGRVLSDPDIGFNIKLPSLQDSDIANQLLEAAKSNDQEINRQTFSLLLTNSFAGRANATLSASSPLNNGYEVLSNQFSNLISQYFDNLDVGVNYRPSDSLNANQTEVAVSTELFNDRVLLEVNGSVQGENQNPNQATTNTVAGEFNLEYKITKDGALRGRVFNEANNYNPTNLNQSPYTQGVGLIYRREFNTFGEFFRNIFKRDKSNKRKEEEE
jgi:hypothetical protein